MEPSWNNINNDIISANIFSRLFEDNTSITLKRSLVWELPEVGKMALVCKRWQAATYDDRVWEPVFDLLTKDFAYIEIPSEICMRDKLQFLFLQMKNDFQGHLNQCRVHLAQYHLQNLVEPRDGTHLSVSLSEESGVEDSPAPQVSGENALTIHSDLTQLFENIIDIQESNHWDRMLDNNVIKKEIHPSLEDLAIFFLFRPSFDLHKIAGRLLDEGRVIDPDHLFCFMMLIKLRYDLTSFFRENLTVKDKATMISYVYNNRLDVCFSDLMQSGFDIGVFQDDEKNSFTETFSTNLGILIERLDKERVMPLCRDARLTHYMREEKPISKDELLQLFQEIAGISTLRPMIFPKITAHGATIDTRQLLIDTFGKDNVVSQMLEKYHEEAVLREEFS